MTTTMQYPGVETMKRRRDINTATIYASPQEWDHFKRVAQDSDRREAKQLVTLAKRAAENPQAFRVIKRPANGKPAYQVKTREALPYLNILADTVDPEGESITLSEVVESLIRGLSLQ